MENSNSVTPMRARPLTISAFNQLVSDALTAQFPVVSLAGEIAQATQAASGHWYLTLKDGAASLRAVLFKREAAGLKLRPAAGQQVLVTAAPSLYAPRGEFQVRILSLDTQGQGSLYEEFERLKAKLQAEGLFEPSRKRPLPRQPVRVGVLTSLAGAALHDFLVTLEALAPRLRVTVFPSLVQGQEAPKAILTALGLAQAEDLDVLAVVRGGGSLEDLWAFNDEQVVRRLAQMPMPVVSGVGHETDFTLTDFVADLRAATPTAAAQAIAAADQLIAKQLEHLARQSRQRMLSLLQLAQQRLDLAERDLPDPRQALQARWLRWSELGRRHLSARGSLPAAAARLQALAASLQALDPYAVLQRGYAILTGPDGRARHSMAGLEVGDPVTVQLADGQIRADVREVLPS